MTSCFNPANIVNFGPSMGRKQRRLGVLEKITLETAGAEGKAIARVEGKVLFVTGAVPGDVVDVQLTRKKSSFMEGYATIIHTLSDKRVQPFCDHFGICGGCKWQALKYEHQLEFKQIEVVENLRRIGHLHLPEVEPILASPQTTNYRNKLEFTFSATRYLLKEEMDSGLEIEKSGVGFHVPGRFDKVVDVNHCYLQGGLSNDIRNEIRTYCLREGLPFFHLKEQVGLMRNLVVRTTQAGQIMVIVCFYRNDAAEITALLTHLDKTFPDITSLMYIINPKGNDSYYDLEVIPFRGTQYIEETIEDTAEAGRQLRFRIGPKSFYQVNPEQTVKMYNLAKDFSQLTGGEVVYDLYTGTGTIACFVSNQAKKVVGIDFVPEAIEDANVNAALNNITNVSFFAGDMKDVLNDAFVETHGTPDVVITDPPRAGMHPDVVQKLAQLAPKRIIYISCNSATQARDLALLKDLYSVTKVQPLDMFPHTHHVENIVSLKLRT